jgi:LCP family protein required for cell wall assembly
MSGPRRVILMICGALALVVLGLSLSGWLGLRYYDGKVTHVALSFPASSNRPRSAGGGTENILIVGSDSRAGGNAGFGAVAGQRSDTTILAHLDANGTTTLVSFPRDLWVTIPAHRSTGGQQVGDQKSKLNAAFSYGGPSLLVRTIEDLTNIRIDHYLQIDFAGFQRMTDAVDGVDVCVLPSSYREYVAEDGKYSTNTNDPMSGFLGGPGVVHVNGAQGLAFVRQRHGLATGDIARIARQQQFIGAIFRKASSSGVLTNPAKLVSLLDAATSALTLDNGTSLSDLGRLAVRLRSLDSGGVRFATVPATPGERARQSVLLADPTELAAFLSRLTHGAAPTPGPTASGPRSASAPTGVAAVNYHGGRATPVAGMVTGSGGSIQTVQTAAAPATGSCTY